MSRHPHAAVDRGRCPWSAPAPGPAGWPGNGCTKARQVRWSAADDLEEVDAVEERSPLVRAARTRSRRRDRRRSSTWSPVIAHARRLEPCSCRCPVASDDVRDLAPRSVASLASTSTAFDLDEVAELLLQRALHEELQWPRRAPGCWARTRAAAGRCRSRPVDPLARVGESSCSIRSRMCRRRSSSAVRPRSSKWNGKSMFMCAAHARLGRGRP